MISRIGAGVLLLLGLAVQAPAAEIKRNWGVILSADYNSNLGLRSVDEQSGTVLRVSPFYTVQRAGARAKTTFTYAPQVVFYPQGTYDNQVWQYLSARSNIEVVKNNFFLDVYATANPNTISPDRPIGGLTGISDTNPNNLSQTFTAGITPRLTLRVKDYANVNISPGINYVYNSEGTTDNYGGTNTRASVSSGTYFSRMPWSLTYSANLLNNQGNDNFQSTTGRVGYIFNRKWQVYLRLIYDNNSYQSTSSTSGLGWQAGVTWTPTARTSITAGYGDRYFGAWPTLSLSHRARHTAWTARWESTVYNARQELLGQQIFPVTDAFGNPIQNPVTQDQVLLQAGSPALTNAVYVNNNFSATVSTNWRRTPASLNFNYYQRKYQDQPLNTDDYTVYGRIGRNLSARTSLNLSLQWWDHSEQRTDAVDYTQKVAAVWLQRTITQNLSSRLGYSYTKRTSSDPLNEYDNNQIFLAIVLTPGGQGGGGAVRGGAGLNIGSPGANLGR
ncbi:MAG: TIGR03016 family PEP-CTERM system-associated outer membrane protein [Chromatiaceae bacterium]